MLGLFLDMLYMAVCPTKHKRTSSRPEQDLNVCTVYTVSKEGGGCGVLARTGHYVDSVQEVSPVLP